MDEFDWSKFGAAMRRLESLPEDAPERARAMADALEAAPPEIHERVRQEFETLLGPLESTACDPEGNALYSAAQVAELLGMPLEQVEAEAERLSLGGHRAFRRH